MILADLGATVVKIEHPDDPDYARTFPPLLPRSTARATRSRASSRSSTATNSASPPTSGIQSLLVGDFADPEYRFRVQAAVRFERLRRSLSGR